MTVLPTLPTIVSGTMLRCIVLLRLFLLFVQRSILKTFFSIICYNNFDLYKKFRVHMLDILSTKSMFWVRNQALFVNLFADRIIRETSENIGFYRTMVFHQIMAEGKFLLHDFLILDHVRKA